VSKTAAKGQQQEQRFTFAKVQEVLEMPDLLNIQMEAFNELLQAETRPTERNPVGLEQAFQANFPIMDAREIFTLEYLDYRMERPKYTVEECRDRELTYATSLKARLRLSSKADEESDDYIETIEQEVYMGNIPMMTDRGTFVINGAERVVVSQLHRSPGVFFSDALHPNGTRIFSARIIPFRGSWVEFTTDIQNVMYAYIDRKKKFPVTTLLRALGFSSDDELLELFALTEMVSLKDLAKDFEEKVIAGDIIDMSTGEIIANKDQPVSEELIEQLAEAAVDEVKIYTDDATESDSLILKTIDKDISRSEEDALEAIYRQLRSGEAPDLETARALIEKLFFNPKRYDLGEVGRYRINDRLGLDVPDHAANRRFM